MSLFIYREGIEKTNVGYATAMSEFYLLVIIISITIVLWLANKWCERSPELSRLRLGLGQWLVRTSRRIRRSRGEPGLTQALQKTVDLCRLARLGVRLSVSDLLDRHDGVQGSQGYLRSGDLIPWLQFEPNWKGWESLGLSPDTITRAVERARPVPQARREYRDRSR